MAQASWPDPADGRVVDERQYELLAARFSGDGVYWQPGDPAPVYADGTGLHVKIRPDLHGSMRGFGWTSGTGETLPVAPNATGQARVDRVVLRLDRSTWQVRMAVRQGGQAAPALVRQGGDTGVFESHVGLVTVPPGASTILPGDVVSYPTVPGSRTRPQHSSARNPAPEVGEIAYEYNTARWVGWTGSLWRPIAPEVIETEADIALTSKWPSASPTALNRVYRYGRVVEINLNLARALDSWAGAGDSQVGLLPAGYRPSATRWPPAVAITPDNFARIQVNTNGGIVLSNPLKRVDVGRVLRATFTYLL